MSDQYVELRWIFAILRRRWPLIVAMAFLAVAIAYAVTNWMAPVYRASATLLISPSNNSSVSQYNELMASERLAMTYSQMLKDRPVLSSVVTQLGLEESTGELAAKIQAEPISNTQLILLTVSDSDPVQAAVIANTLARVFKTRVEALSAERYAATIKNAEDKVSEFQTRVDDTEAKIGTLRSQKVEKDVSLANKQVALDALWNDYQALQNNQQQLELSIAEATGNVYVFEQVQVHSDLNRGMAAASAVVSVGTPQAMSGTTPAGASNAVTYGQLFIKTPMLQKIITDLSLSETPDQLASMISVESVDSTQLIRLVVADPDAAKAETIGKALVAAFVTQVKGLLAEPYSDRLASIETQLKESDQSIKALQTEIGGLTAEIAQLEAEISRLDTSLTENRTDFREAQKNLESVRITAAESADTVVISEPAQTPKGPSQNKLLYVALAALIGLALGTGLAFLFEMLDKRVRTNQDIRKELGLATLGTIGQFGREAGELVVSTQPGSSPADDYRVLSMHIRRLHDRQELRTLLVTSPTPMEGKSVTVSNLGLALAKTGLKVIAVDADLRLPRLHQIFKLQQEDGLVHSLAYGFVDGNLQDTQQLGLRVLTSGGTPENPAELLTSPNLEKLVTDLTAKANIVLIDCPPVLTAADASILAPMVDGVLLVFRAGQSESQNAQETVEALRQAKANLVGVVLNDVAMRKESYYKYYRNAEGKRSVR